MLENINHQFMYAKNILYIFFFFQRLQLSLAPSQQELYMNNGSALHNLNFCVRKLIL